MHSEIKELFWAFLYQNWISSGSFLHTTTTSPPKTSKTNRTTVMTSHVQSNNHNRSMMGFRRPARPHYYWRLAKTLQGTRFRLLSPSELWDRLKRRYLLLAKQEEFTQLFSKTKISLNAQDVTRWKMAWRARQVFKYGWVTKIIVRRCKDWPDMDNIFDEPPIALGFSAGALIYGGLHALAWFAHFDSSTEQLLWRISACVVMGGLPVIFVLVTAANKTFGIPNQRNSDFTNLIDFAVVLLVVPAGLVLLAYILARGYLVVECFINLSHLPAEVYEVPRWSAYFPHIS